MQDPTSPGRLALVGSGEYLPVMTDVERDLLAAGGSGRYVQLATAAAPEGERSLDKWRSLGAAQGERLAAEVVSLPVVDRTSADDPGIAAELTGAGLVYLSGGNPAYLADTLRGTRVWEAIVASWRSGASLAGCSAGAMAMTSWVPTIRAPGPPVEGLGLLPHLRVIPHFDRILGWVPDVVTRYLLHAPPGVTVLGIDEETALVGGPADWVVQGRQKVWVLTAGGRQGHAAGEPLRTPLVAAGLPEPA